MVIRLSDGHAGGLDKFFHTNSVSLVKIIRLMDPNIHVSVVLLMHPFSGKNATLQLEARCVGVVLEKLRIPARLFVRCDILEPSSGRCAGVVGKLEVPGEVEAALKVALLIVPGFLDCVPEFLMDAEHVQQDGVVDNFVNSFKGHVVNLEGVLEHLCLGFGADLDLTFLVPVRIPEAPVPLERVVFMVFEIVLLELAGVVFAWGDNFPLEVWADDSGQFVGVPLVRVAGKDSDDDNDRYEAAAAVNSTAEATGNFCNAITTVSAARLFIIIFIASVSFHVIVVYYIRIFSLD